ncbi:tetratricopeptide repeat protein [Glycomyces sp. L485]|uniref:tetratricopeptide repeat protein n=1 Tax=Glycomyces sp. L485 TaxID=2909235 RepID=UPI001F4B2A10|nr:tetratricopeptide repeat protein [Glycomyces sp. L485]MCH7230400.1 tetratricopeptide repeat protein [Glycomyces sp. L485]
MSAVQHQIAELIATGNDGRMYATEPEKLRRLVESELAREAGLAQPELRQVGVGLIALGDHARARRVLAAALERAAKPGQSVATLINLGDAHRYAGDLAGAEPNYTLAIETAKADCPRMLHFAMQHYGKHLIDARKPKLAAEVLQEVLKTRRKLGDQALIASTQEALNLARAAVGKRTV